MSTHWSDSFFHRLYPRFDLLALRDSAGDAVALLTLLSPTPQDKLLDVACGYGRVLLPLARRFDGLAYGFDRSSTLLKYAARQAAIEGVSVKLCQANLLDYRSRTKFDGAYMVGTSFGYYQRDADNQRVLCVIRALLRTGGRFVLHQAYNPSNLNARACDGQYEFRKIGRFSPRTGDYTGAYVYRDRETQRSRRYPYRIKLYRSCELQAMMTTASFSKLACYSDLEGNAFGESSGEIVVVARAC